MWAGRDVERWMVQAERADPRSRNPGEARPLAWPDLHVANRDERQAVRLWVWCEARGISYHSTVRARGGSYTTWLARKNRAVERIVMRLNVEESMVAEGTLFKRRA